MTSNEKVIQLKKSGMSYRAISEKTGLPVGTIKSIWSRANKLETEVSKCKECGAVIIIIKGKKPRQFCSDKCRMKWWNAHRFLVSNKSKRHYTCKYCGKEFTSKDYKERKYCSHQCYIEGRYGDEN